MDRLKITLGLLLVSFPAYSHDFGMIANLMGMAVLSFTLSIYLVGTGKRIVLAICLVFCWALVWGIMYYGESMMAWVYGFVFLLVCQPIGAVFYKKCVPIQRDL
jgi:hypothetical protein